VIILAQMLAGRLRPALWVLAIELQAMTAWATGLGGRILRVGVEASACP
jgi:hypothetical protein